jgi:hypothetical protein
MLLRLRKRYNRQIVKRKTISEIKRDAGTEAGIPFHW